MLYHNFNDSYDKPFQNLLHKISSAYVTKPFIVIRTESGEFKYKIYFILEPITTNVRGKEEVQES